MKIIVTGGAGVRITSDKVSYRKVLRIKIVFPENPRINSIMNRTGKIIRTFLAFLL